MGGQLEGKRMEPTIVMDVKSDDILMEKFVLFSISNIADPRWRQRSELFGPILPIVPVDDINEAIAFIRDRPTPLVIYLFTNSNEFKDLCEDLVLISFNLDSVLIVP